MYYTDLTEVERISIKKIYIFPRFRPDVPVENPTYHTAPATPSVQYSDIGPRDTPTSSHHLKPQQKPKQQTAQTRGRPYEGPLQTMPEGEGEEATHDTPAEEPMAYETPVQGNRYEALVLNTEKRENKHGRVYNVLKHH